MDMTEADIKQCGKNLADASLMQNKPSDANKFYYNGRENIYTYCVIIVLILRRTDKE